MGTSWALQPWGSVDPSSVLERLIVAVTGMANPPATMRRSFTIFETPSSAPRVERKDVVSEALPLPVNGIWLSLASTR